MVKRLTWNDAGEILVCIMCYFFFFAALAAVITSGSRTPETLLTTHMGRLGFMLFFNTIGMLAYVWFRFVWSWNDSSPWLFVSGVLVICFLFGFFPYLIDIKESLGRITLINSILPFYILYRYGCRKIPGMGYTP